MNRNLYFFGMFFLGLSAASTLLEGIAYLQLGSQINSLDSFLSWYLVNHLIALVATGILLKYYWHKRYHITFFSGVITALAVLSVITVVYRIITARELMDYFPIFYLVLIATGIVYGISLIFSTAGEKRWLRIAGIVYVFLGLITGSLYIWALKFPDFQTIASPEKFHQWIGLFGFIVPLLFLMNFKNELKALKAEETSENKSSKIFLNIAGIVALFIILIFGTKLATEAQSRLYWAEQNHKLAEGLTKIFEARTFIGSKGDTLLYRLLEPLNYDPQNKYPLVVSLHHGGVHGSDNISQLSSDPAPTLANDAYRRAYSAFIFAPQCPQGKGWGGIPNYPSIDSLVIEAILDLDQEFSIDDKRRYLGGISGGGYGSWHLASIRPDMFAAAIPICGAGNPELARYLVNVPVWDFHGENDKSVPVSGSRDMIAAIEEAGGNPKYTEFPETGHNIGEQVKATPGLYDWLFAQRKD